MFQAPFYDPFLSYYENYEHGPFGKFARPTTYTENTATGVTFCGHNVNTPFGIPAGPLLNSKFVIAALDYGFDIPMYKTVRSGVRMCHPVPNVLPVAIDGDLTLEQADKGLMIKSEYSAPLSITNSFGVPSFDPAVWQPDAAKAIAHARPGQVVGVSFEGTKQEDGTFDSYLADWVRTAKLVAEIKPGFIEANLSCPNEGTTALLCFDIERVKSIVTGIKAAVPDIPLLLKVSYFPDEATLSQFVIDVGPLIDGLSTINTLSAEVRLPNGEQALPGEGRLRSGICGSAIKWAGLDMVRRLASLRDSHHMHFSIVGVGGVTTAEDFFDYRAAGAEVVMSATGAMWNPDLANEIKARL